MARALLLENIRFREFGKTLGYAIAGSLFLALMSQVALHLPFTPIPQTMQTLGVFLLGGILGAKRGAAAVMAYLVQGCMGLPVFAGGMANPLWFVGPTGGFLFSFVLAAFVVGKIVEGRRASLVVTLMALSCAQLLMFTLGCSWLACFIGVKAAFAAAVVPFVVGSVMKVVSGACIIRGYRGAQ